MHIQFGAKEAKRRCVYVSGVAMATTTAAIAFSAVVALLLIV